MAYRTNSLGALKLTAVQTANYSANPYDLVACDVSGGAFTVTLPTAPSDQTVIAVVLVASATSPGATAATTILTVATGGSDVFSKAGGGTTASIVLTNQQETYVYNASGAIWTNGLGRLPRASIPPNKTVAPTASYTAIAGDIVLATAGAGGFTVTLPAVSKNAQVTVKKVDSGAGTITVSPASGTIDGGATFAIAGQYQVYTFVADGTNWWSDSGYSPSADIPLSAFGVPTANIPMNSKKLTGLADGTTAGDSAAFDQLPSVTTVAATGTFTPSVSGSYRIQTMAGGGGGGGGGTATTALVNQQAGAGGGQGESKEMIMSLVAATGYTCTIGAPGAAGALAAAGGHNGGNGGQGGSTTFAGPSNLVSFGGGGGGGGTSTTANTALLGGSATGGGYGGAPSWASTNSGSPGGTGATQSLVAGVLGVGLAGGGAIGIGCGGGPSGGGSSATLGGGAGTPGTFSAQSIGGTNAASATATGVSATDAATTSYGAGGAGGGAGAAGTGASGAGGKGGPGAIIITGPLP